MSAPDVGELPVIATPVSQLKRKRAGTGSASAAPHVEKHVPPAVGADIPPPQSQARHARRIESEGGEVEESDSDDQASLFEDMLELIEEGDYVAGECEAVIHFLKEEESHPDCPILQSSTAI